MDGVSQFTKVSQLILNPSSSTASLIAPLGSSEHILEFRESCVKPFFRLGYDW